jgi:hypothetical protein
MGIMLPHFFYIGALSHSQAWQISGVLKETTLKHVTAIQYVHVFSWMILTKDSAT